MAPGAPSLKTRLTLGQAANAGPSTWLALGHPSPGPTSSPAATTTSTATSSRRGGLFAPVAIVSVLLFALLALTLLSRMIDPSYMAKSPFTRVGRGTRHTAGLPDATREGTKAAEGSAENTDEQSPPLEGTTGERDAQSPTLKVGTSGEGDTHSPAFNKTEGGGAPNPAPSHEEPAPVPDQSRASTCPPGCSDGHHGTCNEELGECFCLPSFTGPDCSEPALPACTFQEAAGPAGLAGEGYTTVCGYLTTCECAMECQRLRLPVDVVCLRGTLENGSRNTDLHAVFEGPRYGVPWNQDQTEVLPQDYRTPADTKPSPLTSPGDCHNRCSGHGQCFREWHTCQCPWMGSGPVCNDSVRSSPAGSSPACFNGCSGHGSCFFGTCLCERPFFGVDCSLFIDGTGTTRILQRPPYSWADLPAPSPGESQGLRPRVYVYDLPGYFNTWQGLHSGPLDWEEPVWFLERLLNSPHRTANPHEADFFYIPLFIRNRDANKANIIPFVLKYIRQRWPFHARSGGSDHIVITNSDWGNCQLGGPGGFRLMSKVLDDVMTLTLWGLARNMTLGTDRACFRPGRDIAIPPIMQPAVYRLAPDFPSGTMEGQEHPERAILLYFRGAYYTDEKPIPGEYRMSFGARQAMYGAFHGRFNSTGVLMEDWNDPQPEDHWFLRQMRRSLFCFAPAGWGWAMRTTQAVIMGCIPLIVQPDVVQPFEGDGLDWSEFSVRFGLEDVPNTEKILRGIPKERVLQMQQTLFRVRSRFAWTSTNLNPFVEFPGDKARVVAEKVVKADVFVAVMEALARRIK